MHKNHKTESEVKINKGWKINVIEKDENTSTVLEITIAGKRLNHGIEFVFLSSLLIRS